jgi:MgtE intracellular N domain/CBS domain
MSTPHTPPAAGTPTSQPDRLYLSTLLKRAAIDARGQQIGRLVDVIVRLDRPNQPHVTGLVAALGRRQVFIPANAVATWHTDRVDLHRATVDLRAFDRRTGEVLLRADVLGHRLVDVAHARLVRAHDIELVGTEDGWIVSGVDVHRVSWLRLPGHHPHHAYRDWNGFEPLVGHQPSLTSRAPLGRLRRLKPAQIADLIEDASPAEQHDILAHVHADPELEADVFEELDEDQQTRLLGARTDAEIAEVIAHMRADDAADTIIELPQDRRQPVLDLLPDAQRTKVRTLLGYQAASAGGLMGTDYLALPGHTSVTDTLAAIRMATTTQPEALTNVYRLDPNQRLDGVTSVVRLLQAEPAATLQEVADPDPIRVHPHADLIEITTVMADHNLLTLPVVDDHDHILGLITIDDVLETAVPRNWRRREPAPLRHHTTPEPAARQGGVDTSPAPR